MNPLRRVFLVQVVLLFAACCARQVDPRPNETVRVTRNQTLAVANGTLQPITFVATAEGGASPLVVPPGGSASLKFVLEEQRNESAGREKEIVLRASESSPLLVMSDLDLRFRAKFGQGTPREIRVGVGECLFDREYDGKTHFLRLARPPRPGIPAIRLCPDPVSPGEGLPGGEQARIRH